MLYSARRKFEDEKKFKKDAGKWCCQNLEELVERHVGR